MGQVLLPSGTGTRNVHVTTTPLGEGGRGGWVELDEDGRFDQAFRGGLGGVAVTAGGLVQAFEGADLPEPDGGGRIDLGLIDLRERLTEVRVVVRAAEGSPGGDVRVGVWLERPPVGPLGEPVSLGSRQFPELALGSETAWLLPKEARSVYFVVERPADARRGTAWRSGHQRQFGPLPLAELPAELAMD